MAIVVKAEDPMFVTVIQRSTARAPLDAGTGEGKD
jgi:hypothetical protein